MNLSKVKSTLAVILLSIFSMLVVGCGSNEITNENDLTNNPDIELVEEAIKSIENIVSIEIVT